MKYISNCFIRKINDHVHLYALFGYNVIPINEYDYCKMLLHVYRKIYLWYELELILKNYNIYYVNINLLVSLNTHLHF